ncbi:hypothetical protein SLEP1_g36848 [Rubroshorea leprosula]|uniref:Uncharacterized protein n=1 Tax=Rubroshorea leprosula TaxID=152421 RepID=A0AAV5KST5_9ROSI|nr:hypothetical protein SLEP1_g36848 [Rubroshorea leprosula]
MSSSYLPTTNPNSIAEALEAKNPNEAIFILYRVLDNPSSSLEALRIKEQAITNLSDLLSKRTKLRIFAHCLFMPSRLARHSPGLPTRWVSLPEMADKEIVR